ncbi:flagellar biosynthetic protein FliO [Phyllobacterium sp. OV277]|uniref:flagellar biosynthetic protein FliO n=1 Tax=Phyllobacterium sp. OV277 TaxID=1882772 RepID=UPI00088DC419|nr:flagellar biosynthetic protein FliO [Phyllobacterium sp. OV277]SDN91679.1 Flagellar biosynthesis protein, FliO [Phyllobacterium sp. OV277]
MNNWLVGIVGETAAPIVGFVLLFALVIVLLLLVFAVLRRVTGGTFVSGGRNRQVRLSVTDAAAVDNRRRLVLVRRDDVEHLIMIGGPSDLVIEQNIRQFAKPQSRVEPAATITPAEAEPKAETKPVEASRPLPVAPARVSPPITPVVRPAVPAQAAAPHIPVRPAAPVQPPVPPRETPQPEHQRPIAAAVPLPPIPPMQPIPPVAAAAAAVVSAPSAQEPAEAPSLGAPQRDNGWQRTASPSFGTAQRSEPHIDALPHFEETRPEPVTSAETRTTTAAAFPFSVQNLKPAQDEASLDILGPAKPEEPEINLADLNFDDAFESDLEGELHVTPDEEPRKEPGNIEDEMERLLDDLSKPEKR